MHPVLFEIFGISVYSHSFFFLLGLLTCLGVVVYESRRRGWPRDEVVPITLAALAGGVFGARVAIIFFHGAADVPVVFDLYSYIDPSIGPGSILGGVAGAYVGGYLASRMIGTRCTCDAFAPAMALGLAVGRIGDYLSGEDGIGKPSSLPWAVPAPGVDYLVHPAPLYDAAFNVLWFAALVMLRDRPELQDGRLLKLAVAGYAVFRFFVEFVRNNPVLVWGLTAQQFATAGLLVAVVYLALRQRRREAAVPAT